MTKSNKYKAVISAQVHCGYDSNHFGGNKKKVKDRKISLITIKMHSRSVEIHYNNI